MKTSLLLIAFRLGISFLSILCIVLGSCKDYTYDNGKKVPIKDFEEILAIPQLAAPADRSRLETYPIDLTWDPVRDAEGYEIFVNKKKIEIPLNACTEQLCTYSLPKPEVPESHYTWLVRAKNHFQYVSSEPRSFWFGRLACPELISPDDNHLQILQHIPFTWDPVEQAVTYTLEFAVDTSFNEVVFKTTTKNNFFNPSRGDLPYRLLYWRVVAKNEAGDESFECPTRRYDFRNYGSPEIMTTCNWCEAIEYDSYHDVLYAGGWIGQYGGSFPGQVAVRWYSLDPFKRIGYFAEKEFGALVHLDGISDDHQGRVFVTSQDDCFFHVYQANADQTDYEVVNADPYGWHCVLNKEKDSITLDYYFGLTYNQFNDRVYILDRRNQTVHRYTTDGIEDLTWKIEDLTSLIPNWGIAADDATGMVYVTCAGGIPQVQIFDADGNFLDRIIPKLSAASDSNKSFDIIKGAPIDLVIDHFSNLIVLISPSDILGYTIDGMFLDSIILKDEDRLRFFQTPFGITVDNSHHLYFTNNTGGGYIVKLHPIHQEGTRTQGGYKPWTDEDDPF